MQTQANDIGFIIWGVRNGFEVILASNVSDAEFLKGDVVTDNMRQICHSAPRRFYSVHTNYRFGAVTIYHTDAKDMVGRSAYIAITLYVPITHQFIGNVKQTLDLLMDFYVSKQGNSSVNMFTNDMIRQQIGSLASDYVSGKGGFGSKLGYLNYQQDNEIEGHLEQVSINGYKAVFFLPPSIYKTEEQLLGYEPVKVFVRTFQITFEGYDPHAYTIYVNNQKVEGSVGSIRVDGLPGDRIVVSEISSGRQRPIEIVGSNQNYFLRDFFPRINTGYGQGTNKPKRPEVLVIILCVSVLLIFAYAMMEYFELDPFSETYVEPKTLTTETVAPKTEIKKLSTDTIFKVDALITKDSLLEKQRKILKGLVAAKKVAGVIEVDFRDKDSIHLTVDTTFTNSKANIIKSITKKYSEEFNKILNLNKSKPAKKPIDNSGTAVKPQGGRIKIH